MVQSGVSVEMMDYEAFCQISNKDSKEDVKYAQILDLLGEIVEGNVAIEMASNLVGSRAGSMQIFLTWILSSKCAMTIGSMIN